jgi:hypothetical protein
MENEAIYPGSYKSAIARAKKVLLAAGFPWSVIKGRYSPYYNTQTVTSGIVVKRVGFSKKISVHFRDSRAAYSESVFQEGLLIKALAIATLREAGLPFQDNGFLECN